MENEFLANIQQEGDLAFPAESERKEKETPSESPADKKPDDEPASPAEKEVDEPSKESDEPAVYHAFHEHPKWIAREQELKELREQNDKLAEFRERAEPFIERLSNPKEVEGSKSPEWFSNLFGEDEEAWKQYQAYSGEERKQIIAQIREEFKPYIEVAEKSKKQSDLDTWATKEWSALEGDPQVQADLKRLGANLDRPTQDEISKVIAKYLPTDEATGNISVRKGFEIWKELRVTKAHSPSPAVEEKKQIANKTITKSNTSEEVKDYKTSADFKGKSFNDLSR